MIRTRCRLFLPQTIPRSGFQPEYQRGLTSNQPHFDLLVSMSLVLDALTKQDLGQVSKVDAVREHRGNPT